MGFQTKLIIISLAVSFVISMLVIPILKKLKVGQLERTEGPQSHLKKQGTPTMGGIIIIITILLVGIYAFLKLYLSGNELEKQSIVNLIPLIISSIGFGVIGLIDDLKKLIGKNTEGLKPAYKMLGLLIVSVAFCLYITQFIQIGTDTYIPFFKTYITLPIWLYVPFAVIVMLATTNAVNLTDGIDGLSTSVTTIIFTTLTVIGFMTGVKEITIFGSILIGTCLGFLIFNLHPAKIMMGDTGSLLIGGAIASMALYLKMPLLLIIVALVPVIETLSVMIQVRHFKKTGKRIFKMTPIHHHFELCGWNENKIVSVFSLITLLCCVIGIASI